MPRKAIWGTGLVLAAICVVAIVRAQEGQWQPAARSSAPVSVEPAYLPAEVIAEATPAAMQIVEYPPSGETQAGFGIRARRFNNATSAPNEPEIHQPDATSYPEEPRPLPILNQPAEAQPPQETFDETEVAQPGAIQPAFTQPGPLPQRSVLRRSGQPPAPTAPPETYAPSPGVPSQTISDENEETQRSILKRPVGASITEAPPPAAPLPMAAPAPEIPNNSSRRMYDPNAAVAPRATSRALPSPTQDLVIATHGPRLRAELAGPQSLLVGKSAKYVLNLVNEGESPAEDVQLRLNLPAWVAVESGETTAGDAAAQADVQGSTRMIWNIPQLKANSQETLRLQIVASEGKPFEVTADWTCRPSSLRAAVVVKQPQLELSLAGPSDMTFGDEKPFTITVSNPGTGDAEQVVVQFIAGGSAPQTIDVGTVPAGKARDVNIKVVANQQNSMELKLIATADGNLRAEAAGRLVVKQPQLAIRVEGPPLKFAGADAVYAVTVSNTGNAAADDLTISATLPTGAKYLGGVEGAIFGGGVLKWRAGLLPPETERTFEIRCQLMAAGVHRVVVQALGPKSGAASHETETTVEAVSNLKLAVNDPAGPAPVGADVTYELVVMNRGTLAAKNVKLLMQFSEGLEPASVDGAEARIVPGQVLFDTLSELAAGEQVVVHVKAKADREGAHRFRVEVVSTDNDTRLVSEGTTRFFADGRAFGPNSPAARTATKPKLTPTPIQNLQR
jgi:hypothetical protein